MADSSSEEDAVVAALFLKLLKRKILRRRRSIWVRPWIGKRYEESALRNKLLCNLLYHSCGD